MERCCLLGPMLDVFLLLSTTIISQTAADIRLHCVNDYLYTINCSLTTAPEESGVNWLSISDYNQRTWCRLTEADGGGFCSVHISSLESDDDYLEPLNDLKSFQMSVCGSMDVNSCRLLVEDYAPQNNIKPNAPCCLSHSHNLSQHQFTWRSTYEEYSHFTALTQNMVYQFHLYARGQGNNVSSHELITESLDCSVSAENLVPGAEYGARVRSSPNQDSYQGEWSDWSSELHWKAEPAEPDLISSPFLGGLGKELFLLCVMALLLLLSFACVKRWRRHAYIPTPAPYFHSLYNVYHGDFKSWVVTRDKMADGLKAEQTLQVDTFIKCVDVQELGPRSQTPQQIQQEAMYSNIPPQGCDSSLLGVPYAVSTAAPTEDNSGCWMCSKQALESSAPLYSNEYCTLSAFHQTHGCSRGPACQQHAQYNN